MKTILISWIGATDLKAMQGVAEAGSGPIAQAAIHDTYASIVLLSDYSAAKATSYKSWLAQRTQSPITIELADLCSPTDYGDIYRAASEVLEKIFTENDESLQVTIHLSPGTPAMAAVWVLLAKTKYSARLIESSKEYGVKETAIPFDIAVDFIPGLLSAEDKAVNRIAAGIPDVESSFEKIIYRSEAMQRVIAKARQAALRSVPVLLEGESGTGKELFATAIHKASPRKDQKFITINCGAIPKELIESELFGHTKGAFSGATTDRTGHFEAADKGTIFLDEIGELPLDMQVRLLRVLQEGEVKPIGSTTAKKIDVRIIAATNRNLIQEVAENRFREDLFYRLAVAVIHLPPLRERKGDISLLIDHLMEQINRQEASLLRAPEKDLSVQGRSILLNHHWPGNIRELQNTITRAVVWATQDTITPQDIEEALLPTLKTGEPQEALFNYPLEDGFSLDSVIDEVKTHYLRIALDKSHGKKKEAAKLLGIPNYQTLSSWQKKYKL